MSVTTTSVGPTTATNASTSTASTSGSLSTSTILLTSAGQSSATSPATSTNSSFPKPTTSASSSQSSQKTQDLSSTNSSPASTLSTPTLTPQPGGRALPNHRFSNGVVAGIVVGVALGLALITFLATFAIMRRQRQSRSSKRSRSSEERRGGALGPRYQGSTGASRTHENYLPQSADDKTIQQNVRSTLDQIELHVENFYRNSSSSTFRPDNRELSAFDSPYLSASLASLLPHSRNKLNIIKHALAQSVTSSLSPTADSPRSLMPTEYTLLPSTITSTKSNVTQKPGKYHMSHIQTSCS